MATNFHSQSVTASLSIFDGSNEVRIASHVNDTVVDHEIYRCKIHDHPGSPVSRNMTYLSVNHANDEIILGKFGYYQKDRAIAILTGETQTLNHMDIRSNDGKVQGNMYDNIICDFRNCPVMECLKRKSGKSIIQSYSNKVVIAQIILSKLHESDLVISILYNTKVFLNSMTKMFAMLLAFKTYRAYIRPATIISPYICNELDGLTNTHIYTISKASYGYTGYLLYSYFNVTNWPERQCIFSFETSTNGKDGFIFKSIDTNGRVMFTANLPSVNSPSRIYIDNQQEIGMMQKNRLHVGSFSANKMQGTFNPENNNCVIRRVKTKQRIANIEPSSKVNPKEMIIFIHPAIDTQHKAIILTYALQLSMVAYRFFFDKSVIVDLSQPIPNNYSSLGQLKSSNTPEVFHPASAAVLSTNSSTSTSQARTGPSQMPATHTIPPRSELSADAAVFTPGYSSHPTQTRIQLSAASPLEPPLGATPLMLAGPDVPTIYYDSPNGSSGMTDPDYDPQNQTL